MVITNFHIERWNDHRHEQQKKNILDAKFNIMAKIVNTWPDTLRSTSSTHSIQQLIHDAYADSAVFVDLTMILLKLGLWFDLFQMWLEKSKIKQKSLKYFSI